MNPFVWIRRRVAESVLDGFADGVRALTPDGEDPPADIGDLRQRLAAAVGGKALPAAPDVESDPTSAELAVTKRKAKATA